MSQYDFDLFIIGGGSGGVRAARIAGGQYKAKVAVAEEYRFGGTCVIRGCVPKKLLVYASRFRDEFEDAEGFGWTVKGSRFDWPTLIANKDREISRLEGAYRRTAENAGAKVFDQRATVVDPHTVKLADGAKVTAKVILVATGGHPMKPDIPGAEHAITSNEAFHLEELPASVLIVGGGYIAVEFAGIFDGLGAETTLVYRGEKVLRGFDEDLRDGLMSEMFKREIDVRVNAEIASIEKNASDYTVTLKDGTTLEVECVMFATGRSPNTRNLGLDKAGVKLGKNGEVIVDAQSRSSVPSIYAVGDVTDRVNLTPVAIREGHAFADTVFGNKPWNLDHDLIPTAVFSTPEIATVGLPEHIACQHYPDLHCYRASFRPLKHTLSGRDERVILKLLVDGATDKVVGCHMLGPDAAEIIQMAAIALKMGATKADFDATVALHPSIAEEFVTLRDKRPAMRPPPADKVPAVPRGYNEKA